MSLKLSGARVKGLAFRTLMQEFAKLEGPAAFERACQAMPAELATRYRESRVVASTWYPVEDYALTWNALQAATGNRRDMPRVLGRLCVAHDLNVVHKLVFRALSVPTVIGLSLRVFSSYYDTGSARAGSVDDRTIRAHFQGCKGWTAPMWGELRGQWRCLTKRPAIAKPGAHGRRAAPPGIQTASLTSGGSKPRAAPRFVQWGS